MNAVHISNLLTTQVQFVPTVAAELHSADDVVFAQALDVTGLCPSAGDTVRVEAAKIVLDAAAQVSDITLHFFNAAPAAGTTPGGAFALSEADGLLWEGALAVSTDYGATAAPILSWDNNKDVRVRSYAGAAPTDGSRPRKYIYVTGVTAGTPTYATTSSVTVVLTLAGEQSSK